MQNTAANMILQHDMKDHPKAFLESLFASYHDKETQTFKKADFAPADTFKLTPQDYKYLKQPVETTLGILFFNRFVLEGAGIIDRVGYFNEEVSNHGMAALNAIIGPLCMADVISMDELAVFIDNRDKIGFWCSAFMSSSISPSLLSPMPDVEARKAELLKQRATELDSDNPVEQIMAMNEIEKELMGMVRGHLKSDIGYELYESGVGNLDNNYKTINVMRGAVFNNGKKKYDIVQNSLMNGITKKDIPAFSNSITAAAYPSAVGTAEAGVMSKKLLALLQSEQVDPDPNSDCGTKITIPFTILKKNKRHVLYRYINDGGKRVLLTPDNVGNYVDKVVNLYSPQCCLHDKICGKCAGQLFYKLGVTQVGLLTTQITQKLLNLKLKSKHDLSQSAGIIPEKYVFADQSVNQYFTIEKGVLTCKTPMKIFIPRVLEEISGFVKEASMVSCMGVLPVQFLGSNGNMIATTFMSIPAILSFNVYDDLQEDPAYYIISYDTGSIICNLGIQKSVVNVELYLNQIFLNSHTPQIPYNYMVDYMFRCLDMNGIDLTGPTITYEMLARRVCRDGAKPFAFKFGAALNVNPMDYTKQSFTQAVQDAGILQGMLFRDVSKSIKTGLVSTINGKEPVKTPLEDIIKA